MSSGGRPQMAVLRLPPASPRPSTQSCTGFRLAGSGVAITFAVVTTSTPALMARLGRSSPMALRYQHATLERDREIADRLGAMLKLAAAASEVPIAGVAKGP
jgi:hypothetical protein